MSYLSYDNIYRTSPSNQLKLEICSPHNNPGGPPGVVFQAHFAITVREAATGEFIWQNVPGKDSQLDKPEDAWISDEGFVVVLTKSFSGSYLFILNPQGDICLDLKVSEKLPGCNKDEMGETFRSVCRWNFGGNGVFFSEASKYYWGFRTIFDRRIVFDLDMSALIDADLMMESMRNTEHAWALDMLHHVSTDERTFLQTTDPCRVSSDDSRVRRLAEVAARWCGIDSVAAAVPYLLRLEHSTHWGSIGMGWSTPDAPRTSFVSMSLTQAAQVALRRIGREPPGIAPYQLWRYECCDDQMPRFVKRISIPECLTDRPIRLRELREGMSRHEVTQIAGMPDFDWGLWDYDVLEDEGQSYTVRVTFDQRIDFPSRVNDILKFPPVWRTKSKRDIDW